MRAIVLLLAALLASCAGSRPRPEPRPDRPAPTKRTVRVLYVEGQLRFGYRALRGLFHESTLYDYEVLLITPKDLLKGGPATEVYGTAAPGRTPPKKFPSDLSPYDLVIVGDIEPDALGGSSAAYRIAEYVRKGGGLILMAGEHHMPASWLGTEVGRILPFDQTYGYVREAVGMSVTGTGKKHSITKVTRDPAKYWEEVEGLIGFVKIRGLRKEDPVLLEARMRLNDKDETEVREPILLAARAERGRVVVLLTDSLHSLHHLVTRRGVQSALHDLMLRWARKK